MDSTSIHSSYTSSSFKSPLLQCHCSSHTFSVSTHSPFCLFRGFPIPSEPVLLSPTSKMFFHIHSTQVLCWMDMEEHLWRRREQYRLWRDRETPEKAERRMCRNWECMRAAMTLEQRRLERTRNVQVNKSTWDHMCVVTHSLTWTLYLSWQASLEYHWDYFLCFEQQQRGSTH